MRIALSIAAMMMFLSPAVLRASDPFLGRWTLDVARSKYPPGTCPKQMTIEMTAAGHGVHYHSETTLANGGHTRADYTAEYDEKPVMVVGAQGVMLPVSLKRTAPNVVVASYSRGFQVMATSRRVLSPDGRIMTVTTKSRDASGKTITNIGIYRRAKNLQ